MNREGKDGGWTEKLISKEFQKANQKKIDSNLRRRDERKRKRDEELFKDACKAEIQQQDGQDKKIDDHLEHTFHKHTNSRSNLSNKIFHSVTV